MPAEIKPPSPEDVVSGQVPIWMDAPFFQKALREGGDDPKIRIVECDVEEALGKGENYVSIVYRACVKDGNGKEHHLIVKCLPSNEARKKLSNQGNFFRKEIDMYEVVFPTYEKLQPKKDISLPWPKHYFSVFNGDCDYLVMEDLKKSEFVMGQRHKGLDRDHLEVALSALGRYHANSYMAKILDPENFKKLVVLFPESIFNKESREMMETFVKTAFETTASLVRDWGGERYEKIASKIEKLEETVFDAVSELLEPVEPGAVITHGDFWINNMLFKYSKEAETGRAKPIDIKLLDFQIARYSTPVTDLMYLMASCITEKTRKEHWNNLLENAYLKSFWDTMEHFGLKEKVPKGLYTMDWLRSEIRRMLIFTFMSALTVTPAVLAESEEAPDMDKLTEEQLFGAAKNPFVDLYKGKSFVERFRELVDYFDEEGLFV